MTTDVMAHCITLEDIWARPEERRVSTKNAKSSHRTDDIQNKMCNH